MQGGADSVRLQLEEQLRETQTELDSKQRELEVVTVQMQRQEVSGSGGSIHTCTRLKRTVVSLVYPS